MMIDMRNKGLISTAPKSDPIQVQGIKSARENKNRVNQKVMKQILSNHFYLAVRRLRTI